MSPIHVTAKPVKPRSETRKPSVFWLMTAVVIPFLGLGTKLRIQNREKLPATGAYVLAPNHYSEIDPLVMGVAVWKLGRAPRFLAKASLFSIPVFGWAMRRSGQIPVERGGRGTATMKAARKLANDGRLVIVYPEGTLTRDPDLWPMRGKTGAVRIALESGIPVIPIAHWGAQNFLPRYGKKLKFFPRSTVDILIGDPIDLSNYAGRRDATALAEATEQIMSAITGLLEQLRAETAPVKRWQPGEHGQSEVGRFDG